MVPGRERPSALGRKHPRPDSRHPRFVFCSKQNPMEGPGDTRRLVEAIKDYSTRLTTSSARPTFGPSAAMALKTTEVRTCPSAGRVSCGGGPRKLGARKLAGAGGTASQGDRMKAGRFQEAIGALALTRKVFSTR